MKPDTPVAMTHHAVPSDHLDILRAAVGALAPELGHVEWLLDRIEGRSGSGRWA